jgi:hypothetical protein
MEAITVERIEAGRQRALSGRRDERNLSLVSMWRPTWKLKGKK